MSLQTVKEQKGFTIVELLIVIVVIGILAAITIVAFNGVQNQAKATKAQSVASDIQKKAEAYNAMNGRYPLATEFSGIAALSSGNTVGTANATRANGETYATYTACGTTPITADTITGARVRFFDYTSGAAGALTPNNNTSKTLVVGTC